MLLFMQIFAGLLVLGLLGMFAFAVYIVYDSMVNTLASHIYIGSCMATIVLAAIICVSPAYRMFAIYASGVNIVVWFTSFIVGLMYEKH